MRSYERQSIPNTGPILRCNSCTEKKTTTRSIFQCDVSHRPYKGTLSKYLSYGKPKQNNLFQDNKESDGIKPNRAFFLAFINHRWCCLFPLRSHPKKPAHLALPPVYKQLRLLLAFRLLSAQGRLGSDPRCIRDLLPDGTPTSSVPHFPTQAQKHGLKGPFWPHLWGFFHYLEIFLPVSSAGAVFLTPSTWPQGVLGLLFACFIAEQSQLVLFITPLTGPGEQGMS